MHILLSLVNCLHCSRLFHCCWNSMLARPASTNFLGCPGIPVCCFPLWDVLSLILWGWNYPNATSVKSDIRANGTRRQVTSELKSTEGQKQKISIVMFVLLILLIISVCGKQKPSDRLVIHSYWKKNALYHRPLEKYVAGSTEDLARLFSLEKDLWKLIQGNLKSGNEDIRGGLNLTDWRRVLEEDDLAHVSNPLAAFQVELHV